ncbi:MAG: CcoQ/FixQ family Cbb3-type cytochrome c oxidase assembly chaperone [Sphingobacteriia bacterium]|jgi:cbb3-type cytochrome oxidase subunit 3
MKFKNYLTSIDHVGIYPLISLLIFTVFFAVVTWYVFSASKASMIERSNIPIND